MHTTLHTIPGGRIGTAEDRFPAEPNVLTPAPHDYDVKRGEHQLSTTNQLHGGVMAGRDKSELDRIIRRSRYRATTTATTATAAAAAATATIVAWVCTAPLSLSLLC